MSALPPVNSSVEMSEIARLEKMIKEIPQFSSENQALAIEALTAYRGLLALGKLSKFVVLVLAGISAAVVGANHFKDILRSWLL